MRKFLWIFFCLSLILGMFGCSGNDDKVDVGEELQKCGIEAVKAVDNALNKEDIDDELAFEMALDTISKKYSNAFYLNQKWKKNDVNKDNYERYSTIADDISALMESIENMISGTGTEKEIVENRNQLAELVNIDLITDETIQVDNNEDILNSEDVLKMLTDGGIPISYSIVYDDTTDPNQYAGDEERPYLEKAGFADERIDPGYDKSEPRSGTIEVFQTLDKALNRANDLYEYKADSYVYRIILDNVLIRLSKKYSVDQAENIADILNGDIHSIDYDVIAMDEKFGDMLDSFQGEWHEKDSWRHLIISREQIYSFPYPVYGSAYGSDVYKDECEEYKFDFDEEQNLVISRNGKPKFTYAINESGKLECKEINDDDVIIYEKVSENVVLPELKERVAPRIGMTELEVYQSTWGSPKKRNKTTTIAGEREQWVYDNGYIYVENGIVTAIQER